MDALRAADGALLTTDDVAGRIMEAKGFDAADAILRATIRDQVICDRSGGVGRSSKLVSVVGCSGSSRRKSQTCCRARRVPTAESPNTVITAAIYSTLTSACNFPQEGALCHGSWSRFHETVKVKRSD
jgi:hypothetical protein